MKFDLAKLDTILIKNMIRGQVGTTLLDDSEWVVFGTKDGVAFLDDGDFMPYGGTRLLKSSMKVHLLPKGSTFRVTV